MLPRTPKGKRGWLIQAIGVGLVLIALIDIYLTLLYPRSGKGWVSVPLSKAVWLLFRRPAYAFGNAMACSPTAAPRY